MDKMTQEEWEALADKEAREARERRALPEPGMPGWLDDRKVENQHALRS
jgi:hypothetical protein